MLTQHTMITVNDLVFYIECAVMPALILHFVGFNNILSAIDNVIDYCISVKRHFEQRAVTFRAEQRS